MLYFDSAASFPLLPEVSEVLQNAFVQTYANSSSTHILGEQANNKISQVRELIADTIGALPSEILFTSGATESNNFALKSLLLHPTFPKEKNHIVSTSIEHKCVLTTLDYLSRKGWEITYVKPNADGIIEPESIANALKDNTALVSVMHVNNELGTVNPISDIGAICVEKGILFHSDAAQSFCKEAINVDDANIDLMSITAHKIGGPKGIGAVYIRDLSKKQIEPVIHGGGQESGVRGGTVATPLIEGFGAAIKVFPQHYEALCSKELKQYFYQSLDRNNIPYHINGRGKTVPHCTSVTLPKTAVGFMLIANANVMCLSQGSACSSKNAGPSHVLLSLGLAREHAENTIRLSLPMDCSKEDIDFLVEQISLISEKLAS